jgi:hypothetical protein
VVAAVGAVVVVMVVLLLLLLLLLLLHTLTPYTLIPAYLTTYPLPKSYQALVKMEEELDTDTRTALACR